MLATANWTWRQAARKTDRGTTSCGTHCLPESSLPESEDWNMGVGVLLSGPAWLQQQAALSFALHLSAERSSEVGTQTTGGKVLPSLPQRGQLPKERKCTAMEAPQAAKHLTPHTSHRPIFVSGCQSHHLLRHPGSAPELHTNNTPSLSPGAMLS